MQDKSGERSKALDLSLRAQEFFFEAGEVESWLNEKNDVLSSTDYGRDRDAATKLLTKHKVCHFAKRNIKYYQLNNSLHYLSSVIESVLIMLLVSGLQFTGC